MPMFKKGKPETKDRPAEAQAPVAAAVATARSPVIERTVQREAAPAALKVQVVAAEPAAAEAVEVAPAPGTPTPGESLLEGVETEKAAETPAAAIDDATTSNLMHIFTEDKEGMNANATIYEAFMEPLTMAQVAANAQRLLDDLRAPG
ncbi:MAG: hypothetical protein HYY34_01565 [Chloroflexi bacterium]|nr:hypothetical protein [Chloroflexota bacterium]